MSLVRKRNQSSDGSKDLANHSICAFNAVRPNEFPNFVKIDSCFRMEGISRHQPDCSRDAAELFSRKYASISSAGISFTSPLLISSYREFSIS